MFHTAISNSTTSLSEDASVSSGTKVHDLGSSGGLNHVVSNISPPPPPPQKIRKKRNLPGNPDPDAEVIALSPKTLLATNRFVCEICHKGFQRDQNLQLHRRGHNLPWKLKQRNSKEVKKKAYVCPEPSCVHHNPSRALGDLTGIKKHFCRKHGEKKWKCQKCSKIYAVQSDWKAHSKTCGTREYRCDCGTLFSRKDSFITHRAFCDALAEESARVSANQLANATTNSLVQSVILFQNHQITDLNQWNSSPQNPNPNNHIPKPEAATFHNHNTTLVEQNMSMITSPLYGNIHLHVAPSTNAATSAHMSATALLQKAATVGAAAITGPGPAAAAGHVGSMGHVTPEFGSVSRQLDSDSYMIRGAAFPNNVSGRLTLTRDFLGLTDGSVHGGNGDVNDVLTFTGGVEYHSHALLKPQHGFGFVGTTTSTPQTWGNC